MTNVVRFALSSARDLYVPDVGWFVGGVLDVPADLTARVARSRYRLQPFGVIEIGTVDSETPKPTLPAVPVPPAADPFPQYVDPSEVFDSSTGKLRSDKVPDRLSDVSLRAAFVPFWTPTEVVTAGVRRVAPDGKTITRISNGTSRASYDATEAALWTVVASGTSGLTPTATKTATYSAAAGDLAMMNVAGGGTVLTLPTAPANKSQVGYRAIGATTAVPLTINRGGTDTIGTAGATSAIIPLADETVVLQYDAANTRWLAVANARTQASVDARYVKQDVGGRALPQRVRRFSGLPAQPVATTGGVGHSSGTGNAGALWTSRAVYKMAVACTDIQLVYPTGWSLSSGGAVGEIAIPATMPTVKASIELANGTILPVYFRGSRTASCDPNGQLVSDPIAVELNAGDLIYVRSFVGATAATSYTMGASSAGPGITPSGTIGFSNSADLTDSGTTFTSDLTKNYWSPAVVCGQPTGAPTATVGVVGDSITVGTGSSNSNSPWWKYGLNNTLPAFSYARSGILAQGIAAAHQRGFPLLQGLSHALVLLGTNDAGRTFAQIQADLLAIWTALANRGIKVYACTINPTTTTTDAWATTANQTVKSGEAVRVQINDWIRTTPAPLTGYIDTADATETARNSGKWQVNGTANYATPDGIHPSDVMHQAMGAAIPALTL